MTRSSAAGGEDGAMPNPNSISIVVPALNEEEKLDWSVRSAIDVARRWFDEVEVLIFNDGSTDRTGEVAEALAREFPEVTAYHNPRPSGLGGVLRRGVELARMRYFFWVDGKGATSIEALNCAFAARDQADLVILYAVNQHERPFIRRVIASTFRGLVNTLFSLRLRQHTHPVLCKTKVARQVEARTVSYAYQAEALVKMIKAGCTYVELGVRDDFSRQRQHSKVFRLANVVGVAVFFVQLAYDVHVKKVQRELVVRDNA